MPSTIHQRCVLAALVLVWIGVAQGQTPSGQFTFGFTNTTLWDLTGEYTNDVSGDVVILQLDHLPNGKIVGTRNETYDNGSDSIIGNGSAKGKVFSKPGQVVFATSTAGFLSGTSGGVPIFAKFTTKGTGTIVPSTLTVVTDGTAKVCVVGRKCTTTAGSADLPLPAGMDGTWALDIDITADGTKLSGTGTLTLSSGRTLPYLVTGKDSKGVVKLKMAGTGEGVGTGFQVTADEQMNLVSMKGKAFGQKLSAP